MTVSTHNDVPIPGAAAHRPASAEPSEPDPRPAVRIAVFGLGQKFHRLLEIVIRHARHTPYRYVLAASRGPGEFDLALVDMTVKGGAEVARTLRRIPGARPVVTVGRRADPARPRDDLLHAQFTADLLPALHEALGRSRPAASEPVVGEVPEWSSGAVRSPAAPLRPTARSAAERAEMVSGASDTGRSTHEPPATARRRPWALIVDDSPTVRSQLSVALRQMGLDSDVADRAELALEFATKRRYDLVFVDVMMPGIDGFRLTRAFKRDRALRGVPVVILTSRSSPLDLARGALAGCNSYLVKPVSMKSLRETVARHLRHLLERPAMVPGALTAA